MQLAQEPESSLHWKLEPLSLELKARLALVEVVVVTGPESIVVFGAVVSAGGVAEVTVQLRVAGEASVLPVASVALTANVWEPIASPAYDLGEAQLAQEPESSEHWKLALLSLEVNPKLAPVAIVEPDGPELIVVSGAVVSAGGGVGGPSGTLEALRGSV